MALPKGSLIQLQSAEQRNARLAQRNIGTVFDDAPTAESKGKVYWEGEEEDPHNPWN